MAKSTNTYELAYECCDTVFFEDGRFPTIDSIRERIHVNSPAIIKRAMNDWTLHFAERHREKLQNPNMPSLLIDASESIWKLALTEANQAFSERSRELDLREAEWKSEIAAIQQLLKESEVNWNAEKLSLNTELESQSARLTETIAKLEQKSTSLDETERALSETKQALSRADGALTEARSAHESQAKEWAAKFDRDHDWHLKRIEEEKEALRAQHAKTISDQSRSLQMARMDQDSLRARLTQIMNQVGDSLERQSKLEVEMEQLKESIIGKDKALQVALEKFEKLKALVKRQRRPTEQKAVTVEVAR